MKFWHLKFETEKFLKITWLIDLIACSSVNCWLVGFYGISTFVGYVMQNFVYAYIYLTKDFYTNTLLTTF